MLEPVGPIESEERKLFAVAEHDEEVEAPETNDTGPTLHSVPGLSASVEIADPEDSELPALELDINAKTEPGQPEEAEMELSPAAIANRSRWLVKIYPLEDALKLALDPASFDRWLSSVCEHYPSLKIKGINSAGKQRRIEVLHAYTCGKDKATIRIEAGLTHLQINEALKRVAANISTHLASASDLTKIVAEAEPSITLPAKPERLAPEVRQRVRWLSKIHSMDTAIELASSPESMAEWVNTVTVQYRNCDRPQLASASREKNIMLLMGYLIEGKRPKQLATEFGIRPNKVSDRMANLARAIKAGASESDLAKLASGEQVNLFKPKPAPKSEGVKALLGKNVYARTVLRDTFNKPQRELRDLQLVLKARSGSAAAMDDLIRGYTSFVRLKASSYFLAGGESDDLIQEGLVGLYKAVRDYDPTKETSFRSFAELCVTRQIITAIKTATRFKHTPLNDYVSFHHTPAGQEGDDCTLGDALPGPSVNDPSVRVIATEELQALVGCLSTELSPLESDALRLYLEGNSYEDMAEELACDTKTIDNALQRVKRKILSHQAARMVMQ